MGRNSQVMRQWSLWVLLSSTPTPLRCVEIVRELEAHGVTSRTLRRDLEALRKLGVPVAATREGREVRYWCRGDGPEFRLDPDAVLALHLALARLVGLRGTAPGEAMAQLARRLQARLKGRQANDAAALASRLIVRPGPQPRYERHESAFAAVRAALRDGRVLEMDYEGLDGSRERRRVHPEYLLQGPRALYLVARDESRDGKRRTFRIERITSARCTGRASIPAELTDPEAELAGSVGIHTAEHDPVECMLLVHAAAAARSLRETPWHESQAMVEDGPGRWRVTLHLTSTRELVPMVLAFGPEVEVLGPPALRSAVSDLLARGAALYRAPRPASPHPTLEMRPRTPRVRSPRDTAHSTRADTKSQKAAGGNRE